MDTGIVLLSAFLGGALTVLGGIAYERIEVGRRLLSFIMVATTGMIFSVLLFGMLPASMQVAGAGYAALGFVLGGMILIITGYIFPHTYGAERYEDKLYSILRRGSLVITGIIIYNIPAGLAIGAAFAGSMTLGVAAFAAVSLQNVARGVSILPPLSGSFPRRAHVLVIMLLAGLPALGGAALSFTVLFSSMPVLLASGLSFSAGAMFFVCADQLMPLIKGTAKTHEVAAALFIGVFAGVLMLGI